ncbi:hypothetical protein B296_00044652 [Ensete ventricosum]|uniref:Uncharacterized protein n=1 Tax=Ensete ventricosum TaxID=4639 RepID=A0A426Y123_ENSVE|nr:hypothetical protein B296_00044652 [Ensete ventricosum]
MRHQLASSHRGKTRRCLVRSFGRRGGASFAYWKTKRCLVPAREDEASPRSPVERRDDASSAHGKTRRRLVLSLEDEVVPHPRAGRHQFHWYRAVRVPVSCQTGTYRPDWYIPPVTGGTDRNKEPWY